MEFFAQQLVDGVAIGISYALIALGFTILFGVMKVLNLAQVSTVLVGGFGGLLLMRGGIESIVVIVLGAAVLGACWGVVVERLVLSRFSSGLHGARASDADHLAPFMATVGVVIVLQHLTAKIFGTAPLVFAPELPFSSFSIGGVRFAAATVLALVVATLMTIGVELLLRRTSFGLRLKATAQNPIAGKVMGINSGRMFLAVAAITGVLGAVAGVLVSTMSTIVWPFMDIAYGLKALVVMVAGGLGSVSGAVVAGVSLGVLEAMTVSYFSSSFRDAIAFGLLIVVLLVRPRGLFPSPTLG